VYCRKHLAEFAVESGYVSEEVQTAQGRPGPCLLAVGRRLPHRAWSSSRVVCHLGDVGEAARIGVREAASGDSEHIRQRELFDGVEPSWVEVDVSRVKVDRTRSLGGAWLGLEIVDKLGFVELLESVMPRGGEEISWSMMSLVLVFLRLCDPSSKSMTVEEIVDSIESKHGCAKRIWVMDRGMVSEENVEFLGEQGQQSILGTPKSQLASLESELLRRLKEHSGMA
jgi:hypothetical protein